MCVCVRVCVCERERERESEQGIEERDGWFSASTLSAIKLYTVPEIQTVAELHSGSLECHYTPEHLLATQAKVGHLSGSE